MKYNKIFTLLAGSLLLAGMTSCENSDIEFPDYDYTTAYFAYQQPIRVLNMGSEEYDTSLDREHKCMIYSTFGGSYNGINASVQVKVDNSLCNNLYFANGKPVKAMPESYYNLSTTNFDYKGEMMGGTMVTFTQAFFDDPESVTGAYVIPLVMTGSNGFDKILTGEAKEGVTAPVRTNAEDWAVLPQDYVLYNVSYQSKYAGWWLRQGDDKVTDSTGKTNDVKRYRNVGIEKAEQISIQTLSLNSAMFTAEYEIQSKIYQADIVMTFDGSDKCTISAPAGASYTVSGSGSFGEKSEKLAWGNKDRDGMHISYTVTFSDGSKAETKDDMVWMRSGIVAGEFKSEYHQ